MWALKNKHTDHPFTITEIEDMYPYERDIYISMLEIYLKEREEAKKKAV